MDVEQNKKDNKEFLQKLDTILDQNKTIARGMTLMHEKINEESPMEEPSPMPMRMPQPPQQPPQTQQKMFPRPSPMPTKNPSREQYNKSMFSKDRQQQGQ